MALITAAAIVIALGSGSATGADHNHYYAGYCTCDAAEQAHSAWGIFPPWYGDAGDWIDGAQASGWRVSSLPQVSSIVVLLPGVQASGPYGHVAWVLAMA